jgi:hypothetical protein
MFKPLSICAVLVASCVGVGAFAAGSISAEEQEAVLQTVEVPGGAFDLVIATPQASGAPLHLSKSPEALVMHLVGGKLALTFETAEEMLKTFDRLQSPVGAFQVPNRHRNSSVPAAVYLVPKGNVLVRK